jgi:hypothetical protein
MRTIAKRLVTAVFVVALGVSACAEDDGDLVALVSGSSIGTFVQTWSIEGEKDAGKCARYNADRMRFVLYDQDGLVHATELAPCSAFSLRMSLVQRKYSGAATFVDADGNPINETVAIDTFVVVATQEVTRHADFSAEQMRLP